MDHNQPTKNDSRVDPNPVDAQRSDAQPDGDEKVIDASTSTSTSSDYMGPPYNHRVSDPYEYFDGIFARADEQGMLDEVLDYYGMTRDDITPTRRWSRAKNEAIERDRETEDRRSVTEGPRDGSGDFGPRSSLRDDAGYHMDARKEGSPANSFGESTEKAKGKGPEKPGQKLMTDNPPSDQNINEIGMDKLQTLALPAAVAVYKRQEPPSDQPEESSSLPDQPMQEEKGTKSVFPGNPSLNVHALHHPPPQPPPPPAPPADSVHQLPSEKHSDENVPKSPSEKKEDATVEKPPPEINLDKKVEKVPSKNNDKGKDEKHPKENEIDEKVFELMVMGQLQDMLERESGSPHLNQPPAPSPPEYSPHWPTSPPQELEDQPASNGVDEIPSPPEYLPEWPSSPNPAVESLLQTQQEQAAREARETNEQVEGEESNSSGGGVPAPQDSQEAIGPDVLALLPLIWTLTNFGGIGAPARVEGTAPAGQDVPALQSPQQVTVGDVPAKDDNLGINVPQEEEKSSPPAEQRPIVPVIAISSDTVAREPLLITDQPAPKALPAPVEQDPPVPERAVPQEAHNPWPKDPPIAILEGQPKSEPEAGKKGIAVGPAVSIIGGAVAGVAAFLGVAFVAYPWWKRRQAKQQQAQRAGKRGNLARSRRHARHWRPETITEFD